MINTIAVTGHLGKAPEFKQVGSNNTDLATFSIAVNQYNGRGKEDTTVWYQVNLWGGLSKFAEYLNTGDRVTVLGEPKLDEWTDKDGNQRQSFKIDARQIATPKHEAGESSGSRTRDRSVRHSNRPEGGDDLGF